MKNYKGFSNVADIPIEQIEEVLGITKEKISQIDSIEKLIEIYCNLSEGSTTSKMLLSKVISLCSTYSKALEVHADLQWDIDSDPDLELQMYTKIIDLSTNYTEIDSVIMLADSQTLENLACDKLTSIVINHIDQISTYADAIDYYILLSFYPKQKQLILPKALLLAKTIKEVFYIHENIDDNSDLKEECVKKIDYLIVEELKNNYDYSSLKCIYRNTPSNCLNKKLIFDELIVFCDKVEDFIEVWDMTDLDSNEELFLTAKINSILTLQLERATTIPEIKEVFENTFLDSPLEKIALEKMYQVYLNS